MRVRGEGVCGCVRVRGEGVRCGISYRDRMRDTASLTEMG